MNNIEMKECPFCREMIRNEAVKCRYCSSMLTEKAAPSGYWYRVNRGKKLAGVCTGIANEFNSEGLILPLRVFFALTFFLSGFGLWVYLIMWLLMPAPIDTIHKIPKKETAKTSVVKAGEPFEAVERKKASPLNAVLGLAFIVLGVLLISWLLTRGQGFMVPFVGHIRIPDFMQVNFVSHGPSIWMRWFPGIGTMLIIISLFLIILGGLRFFRFLIGCGLVFIGTLLILIFTPFLPIALFPVVLIVGSIFIILGGIMFIFGFLRG